MILRKIIDESIPESDFVMNPNLGKYRVEVDPILEVPFNNEELCIVMLTKQLMFSWIPLPIKLRKAVILPYDEATIRKLIVDEFPGYEYYDVQFKESRIEVYPTTQILKIDVSTTSRICFMNEKLLDKWIVPINKAFQAYIDNYNKKGSRYSFDLY